MILTVLFPTSWNNTESVNHTDRAGAVYPRQKGFTMERKTQKILDMTACGFRIYCVKHMTDPKTPYRLYCKWYYYNGDRDYGYKTKQIAKYPEYINVIDHIRNFMYNEMKRTKEGV